MQTAKEYLESLSPELADQVKIIMVNNHLGVHTDGNPAKACTDCVHTTPNGGCFMINGNCTWVPEIG